MSKGFLSVLKKTRVVLNTILVTGRLMTMLTFAAFFSTALTAGLYAYRMLAITIIPDIAFTYLQAATIAVGALFGIISGLKIRMDNREAARWLDLKFKTPETFQSALRCVDAGTGRFSDFGEAIMDRVEILCEKQGRINAPWKPLTLRAFLAGIALLASWFFASFEQAAHEPSVLRPLPNGAEASSAIVDQLFSAGSSSPEDLAHSLFPESSDMEEQATTAIREGRLDQIKSLLKRADLELAGKIKRSVSDTERKRLREERDRLADIVRAMEDQGDKEETKNEDAEQEGATDSYSGMYGSLPEDGSGKSPIVPDRNRMEKPGDEKTPAESSGDDNKPRQKNSDTNDEPSQGGGSVENGGQGTPNTIPDIGAQQGGKSEGASGQANATPGASLASPRNWGPISPRALGPEAFIRPDEKAPFFMYMLPGMAPQTSPADIIDNARKSAEAALSRNSVPLDYEEFIAAYFLELMKEP